MIKRNIKLSQVSTSVFLVVCLLQISSQAPIAPRNELQEQLDRQLPQCSRDADPYPLGDDNRTQTASSELEDEDLWSEPDDEELVDFDDCFVFDEALTRRAAIQLMQRSLNLLETPQKNADRKRLGLVDQRAIHLVKILTRSQFEWEDDDNVVAPDYREIDPDYMPDDTLKDKHGFTVRQKLIIIRMKDVEKRPHEQIKRLYSNYKRQYLCNWRKQLRESGIANETRSSILEKINQHTLEHYRRTRQALGVVQGWMLRRWARRRAIELGARWFKASASWLLRFKRRNKITSRKITNFRGRAEMAAEDQTARNLEQFRLEYAHLSTRFLDRQIINIDQSPFNYEASRLRTLSNEGERDTEALVDSSNNIKHSYTILPILSRDGRLLGPVVTTLQEATRDGQFGPRVGPQVSAMQEEYANIIAFSTRSGLMTSELMRRWMREVLIPVLTLHIEMDVDRFRHERPGVEWQDEFPDAQPGSAAWYYRTSPVRPRILLILDSWSGHSSVTMREFFRDHGIITLVIPSRGTSTTQPLDLGLFRQWKIFWKRIRQEAANEDMVSRITGRAGILNMQSLIRDQLGSPQYRDMLRHSWRHTDLTWHADEIGNRAVRRVNEIQFDFDEGTRCEVENCTHFAFIRCAHCGRHLCLDHFLGRNDTHRAGSDDPMRYDQCDVDSDPAHWPLNCTTLSPVRSPDTGRSPVHFDEDLHLSQSSGWNSSMDDGGCDQPFESDEDDFNYFAEMQERSRYDDAPLTISRPGRIRNPNGKFLAIDGSSTEDQSEETTTVGTTTTTVQATTEGTSQSPPRSPDTTTTERPAVTSSPTMTSTTPGSSTDVSRDYAADEAARSVLAGGVIGVGLAAVAPIALGSGAAAAGAAISTSSIASSASSASDDIELFSRRTMVIDVAKRGPGEATPLLTSSGHIDGFVRGQSSVAGQSAPASGQLQPSSGQLQPSSGQLQPASGQLQSANQPQPAIAQSRLMTRSQLNNERPSLNTPSQPAVEQQSPYEEWYKIVQNWKPSDHPVRESDKYPYPGEPLGEEYGVPEGCNPKLYKPRCAICRLAVPDYEWYRHGGRPGYLPPACILRDFELCRPCFGPRPRRPPVDPRMHPIEHLHSPEATIIDENVPVTTVAPMTVTAPPKVVESSGLGSVWHVVGGM